MKRPAYAKQFRRGDVPVALVFLGAPLCWEHAKKEQRRSRFNHLVLPDLSEPKDWSLLKGLEVVLIQFTDQEPDDLKALVEQMLKSGAKAVAVRDFHDRHGHVVTYSAC